MTSRDQPIPTVDLVWTGFGEPPRWKLGQLLIGSPEPHRLGGAVASHCETTGADAVLHWGRDTAPPSSTLIRTLLSGSGDVWHAGLLSGMAGRPALLDAVAPTWMFNRDAEPNIESTSWRLSLDACLVRTEVVRTLGHLDPSFVTTGGASLELGHRWLSGGALMRHVPSLVEAVPQASIDVPVQDELRFVHRRYGLRWMWWAGLRKLIWCRGAGVVETMRLLLALAAEAVPPARRMAHAAWAPEERPVTVTVLIPTLERYPWLEVVLDQLGRQTILPDEIVVIDQTAAERRRHDLQEVFPSLPLRVIELDQRGQSSARNAGLQHSSGEAILFLDDDDDELPIDLIERHLDRLAPHDIDSSCGVVKEPGEPTRSSPRLIRESSVFPTNNTMLRRRALAGSGLFDVAYDHGIRADGDLGMRLYLSGAHLVLDEFNEVLHHRAPAGGLREYGMRKTTYRGSRSGYFERNKLAATEVYLARRYFTERQTKEMLLMRLTGTLSRHGSAPQRALRALVQAPLLVQTQREFRAAKRRASELSETYPVIPSLDVS